MNPIRKNCTQDSQKSNPIGSGFDYLDIALEDVGQIERAFQKIVDIPSWKQRLALERLARYFGIQSSNFRQIFEDWQDDVTLSLCQEEELTELRLPTARLTQTLKRGES